MLCGTLQRQRQGFLSCGSMDDAAVRLQCQGSRLLTLQSWVLGPEGDLERPEGGGNGDEGGSREPDESCCQSIWACVMRQLCIPLRICQPGSCTGCKNSSKTCTKSQLVRHTLGITEPGMAHPCSCSQHVPFDTLQLS